MFSRRGILLAVVIVSAGCGSDSVLGGESLLRSGGLITANIDGAPWVATVSHGFRTETGFAISGTDFGGRNLLVNVRATAGGTYAVGLQGPASATLSEQNGGTWSAVSSTGSGSVTVTTLSTAAASGTFTFTVVQHNGTATRTITGGRFDVSFSPP
jgi:hypothetical protein